MYRFKSTLLFASVLTGFIFFTAQVFFQAIIKKGGLGANFQGTEMAEAITLSEFVCGALKDMGFSSGTAVPGLTDSKFYYLLICRKVVKI